MRKLLKDGQSPLSWHQRVLIATGAARGLQHLHDSFDPPIVHRDVKTANVLVAGDGTVPCQTLNPKWVPRQPANPVCMAAYTLLYNAVANPIHVFLAYHCVSL